MNHKRVERLWRREGLKVPAKQPKRRRLWLTDGSCVRIRPSSRNHVWSYDFLFTRTSDGRPLRLLTVLDEFTRECLAIDVARRITSDDVLGRLAQLLVLRSAPGYLRSDNGPEFTARALRMWLKRIGVQTLYTDPGDPCMNTGIADDEGPPDMWPVDFNDDQKASMQDVIFAFVTTLAPYGGLNQPATPPLNRVDFNGDTFINMQDVILGYVTKLAPGGLNTVCTP